MNKIKVTKYTVQKVELIAAGYEWDCPDCNWMNKEIEVTENVVCDQCGHVFEVEDFHHAIG